MKHVFTKYRGGAIARKIFMFLWPFFLAALVYLSTKFAIRNSGLVEHYFSTGIYPVIAKLFSSFSKLYPISLWDILWILIIWLEVSGLVLVVFRKMKLSRYLLRTLQLLALLYSIFYMLWGYNYFRPTIEKRLGWEIPKADEKLFSSTLDSIIIEANNSYISFSSSDYLTIDMLIEESYRKNSRVLGISYPNGTRRPKIMLLSSIYTKLGVSGYFGPFFNEIHLNYYLLPMDYPFVLAHEKGHQFGITSEAEANLVAYIICVKSGDQRLVYSGYLSLLLYFLRDATEVREYQEYLNKIDSRVLLDLRFRQKYYLGLQSKILSKIQSAANDSYLKANNIEKGVKNYNQVVSLVINWYYNSNNY